MPLRGADFVERRCDAADIDNALRQLCRSRLRRARWLEVPTYPTTRAVRLTVFGDFEHDPSIRPVAGRTARGRTVGCRVVHEPGEGPMVNETMRFLDELAQIADGPLSERGCAPVQRNARTRARRAERARRGTTAPGAAALAPLCHGL
jgi:hypothetical protein